MRCPFCSSDNTRVIDSRLADLGESVRRRRECQACEERFTTFERAELKLPPVIKSDGRREPFDETKLRRGMRRALEKRPVDTEAMESAINRIMRRIAGTGEREVAGQVVGEAVMEELRQLDEVAFIRFASVYRQFQDPDAFSAEVRRLRNKPEDTAAERQLSLLPGDES